MPRSSRSTRSPLSSRSSRPSLSRLALTLPAAAGALALMAPHAVATSTPAQIAAATGYGVGYLKSLQAADGSYAGPGLSNEWAFTAFAAAGTAVADVAPGGDQSKNARTVYRALLSSPGWPVSSTPPVTDFERAALNAYAAGIDPARVSASRNLIADIYGYWQSAEDGYFGPSASFNGTVFGALALAGAKTQTGAQRVPKAVLDRTVTRIRANQHNDGGWNFSKAEGDPAQLGAPSDIDMTGAAMAALCSSGVPATDPDIVQARTFLKNKMVAASGGFNSMFGANVNSNGWAVSGLNACGINPQTGDFVSTFGRTPVDFLIGLQFQPAGGFRYKPGDASPTAYGSIDALRAVAGGGFTSAPAQPVTAGVPRWVAQPSFTAGTTAKVALSVDTGTGSPKVCAVSFTPTGPTATLGEVLAAATGGATPAGCVTAVLPSSGTGTVTSLNGLANSGGSTWKASVDGSALTGATRGRVINVGDTVALRYGS
ncbi:hypothetical protein I3J09_01925 [Streptomyces clavuligerus]|uniref:hypothetical protein n=1 Tax=Streptomyces clavuligerus TaxID=1901 RepID=UPI000810D142|nr:hypothetical protein [Streptomyces clavuligerus]ANW17074.1 hypothetical protein BB341_01950 [Streptomyces clavuligerus]AXU11611.1 hypothetical protein D1794_02055 [Streptomyces clavuligerus]MBY6301439.1 hypothetical protein [Streptomyces clavuligerus]QPL61729.1 hypothetical protein I3J04_01925 [Streptomyces clavuligerus]QPL67762.1 hypothetical protein I3J05_01940 [Streptomyces clavuligerus]